MPEMLAVVGNRVTLTNARILANLQAVQTKNKQAGQDVSVAKRLATLPVATDLALGGESYAFPNFSVEMETGTGKTYVYLRTALTLAQRYGLKKFIIVVPSIAIRQGVIAALADTREHFRALFNGLAYNSLMYDSTRIGRVREFAMSGDVELLVMTLDAFNKDKNVIRQTRDQCGGLIPLHLLQATRPIVILDEPQNMESDISKEALALLNPLCTLRYSATHKDLYNLTYRLSPAEAYRRGLVKTIEVAGVEQDTDAAVPLIRVDEIVLPKRSGGALKVKLTLHKANAKGEVKTASARYGVRDDLAVKTRRGEYTGWKVRQIRADIGRVEFENGRILSVGDEIGTDRISIFRAQISTTIETHLRKQLALRRRGIKVLSLFFIDRVANYRAPDGRDGVIAQIFDKEFERLVLEDEFSEFRALRPSTLRAAYFAQKRTRAGGTELIDSNAAADRDTDRAAFDLIMQDKRRLLDFNVPASFVFSHSALREGWDNPNVFQICTLNQSVSPIRKRQEIGRGVRIALNERGERDFAEGVNLLTVVANESYASFVSQYQHEINEDLGSRAAETAPRLKDATKRLKKPVRLRKEKLDSPEFTALWERIRYRTRYSVRIDTDKLIADCVAALGTSDLDEISEPQITVTLARVVEDAGAFMATKHGESVVGSVDVSQHEQPDLLEMILQELQRGSAPLRLTKRTLLAVIEQAPNREAALTNPAEWCLIVAGVIREQALDQLVNGIQYQRLDEEEWYKLSQLEEVLPLSTLEVNGRPRGLMAADNSLYDYIIYDSDNERKYVEEDLLASKDSQVKLFVKLPSWFTVDTPVGTYNPDWAIAFEKRDDAGRVEHMLYLVRETKSTRDENALRPDERRKVACGKAHFAEAPKGLDFAIDTPGGGVRLPTPP